MRKRLLFLLCLLSVCLLAACGSGAPLVVVTPERAEDENTYDTAQALLERYKLELPPRAQDEETGGLSYGYDLLERAARKRGFLISGGEPDTERMAKVLLDEFRAGRLGHFTLETPEGAEAYGDG